MSYEPTIEHDGATFTIEHLCNDWRKARFTCAVGGDVLWVQDVEVLPPDRERWMMLLHQWGVYQGTLFITTLAEHSRGGTRHNRLHHRVDRRGIETVGALPLKE